MHIILATPWGRIKKKNNNSWCRKLSRSYLLANSPLSLAHAMLSLGFIFALITNLHSSSSPLRHPFWACALGLEMCVCPCGICSLVRMLKFSVYVPGVVWCMGSASLLFPNTVSQTHPCCCTYIWSTASACCQNSTVTSTTAYLFVLLEAETFSTTASAATHTATVPILLQVPLHTCKKTSLGHNPRAGRLGHRVPANSRL